MEIGSVAKIVGIVASAANAGWAIIKPDLARRKVSAGERFDLDTVGVLLDHALDV